MGIERSKMVGYITIKHKGVSLGYLLLAMETMEGIGHHLHNLKVPTAFMRCHAKGKLCQ